MDNKTIKLKNFIRSSPISEDEKRDLLDHLSGKSVSGKEVVSEVYGKLDNLLAGLFDKKAKACFDIMKKAQDKILATDSKYEMELKSAEEELSRKLSGKIKTLGGRSIIWARYYEKVDKIRHAWGKSLNDINREAIMSVDLSQ